LLLPSQLGFHLWLSQLLIVGRRIDYLSPTFYLSDLIVFAYVVRVVLGEKSHNLRPFLFVLFIVAGWCVANLFMATYKIISLYEMIRLAEFTLLGYCLLIHRPRLSLVIFPLSIAASASAFLALLQFFQQKSIGGILYFLGERSFSAQTAGIAQVSTTAGLILRPYATFPHPNVLAGFLLITLPFVLWSKAHFPLKYCWKWTTVTMILIGLFISFSRIAWILAALMGLLYLLRRVNLEKRVLFLGMASAAFIAEELVVGRFSQLVIGDVTSLDERRRLFGVAMEMVKTSPFLGVGLGNFLPLLPRFMSPPYLLQPVHSIYVLALVEGGVIGLGLFIILVTTALLRRLKGHHTPLLVSLGALLLTGAFDHYWLTLQQGQLLLTLLLALSFM
jgi:O-antigen ligase